VERVVAAADATKDEIIDFLQGLVRIPTENPPGREYRACAEFVGRRMAQLGYKVEYIPVPPELLPELAPEGDGLERVNVIGRLPGSRGRPVLHFNGHYDVVPAGPGWSVDPFGGEIRDGKLYGRGSSDQKSGIAAQVFVPEVVRRAGYRLLGTLESSATPDEETGGFAGVGYLVRTGAIARDRTDYVVITECLDKDRVCIGHRGTLWMEVQVFGRKAHGSMPSLGVNAVEVAGEIIHRIESRLKPVLGTRVTDLPVVPEAAKRASIAVTVIEGGTKVNTVPDVCRLRLDRRLVPGETIAGAVEEVRSICEDLCKERGNDFRYEVKSLMQVGPTLVSEEARVVRVFREAGRQVMGAVPGLVISPGSDDQKFIVQQAGIDECIIYGPGLLEQAHQTDEYVPVQDVLDAVKVMTLAAMQLLGYELRR
jgi:succinyl-diaminopimelate desuccinylase